MDFEALGTSWHVQSTASLDNIKDEILTKIGLIDHVWSRFRSDSMVTAMANIAGTYPLTSSDYQLINFYAQLYEETNGQVSPLIGQTLADAGYDVNYTLHPQATITPTPTWGNQLYFDQTSLTLTQPQLLDVGAAGKGWAIDQIATILKNHQHHNFIIDAGGDIAAIGPSRTIGLEHPLDPSQIIGTVNLHNRSLCGSAINRRVWHGWHHILDPLTSRPTTSIIATWVLADTTMKADGLATALFFVEPLQLATFQPFTYVVIDATEAVHYSNSTDLTIFT
jgi:thiamine biosynthesis lipoprotein